ncbi:MAG TPA: hypothetical protein VI729_12780 [Anaerolineales bacterium]|nr:hypothetical protein [Anaerolineales bacterium]
MILVNRFLTLAVVLMWGLILALLLEVMLFAWDILVLDPLWPLWHPLWYP